VGIVDYHGSRVVALERVTAPTSSAVIDVLGRAFDRHGTRSRLHADVVRDRGFLLWRGVDHTTTRPAHPWTNGRIERLFGTFKRKVFTHIWLFASVAQIDRFCPDFAQFYNRDRPHSSYGGLTPNEVHRGEKRPSGPRARVSYFDGRLRWYRFG
jgi:transposase InsO family protein